MTEIFNSFLNMICFTMPEALFSTIMTYTILKKFKMLDIYQLKQTAKNILIPSVISALSYHLIAYFDLVILAKIFASFIMYILILYCLNNMDTIGEGTNKFIVLAASFGSLVLTLFIEGISLVILLALLKVDLISMFKNNENFLLKWITSFVWMTIEMFIVIVIYRKSNTKFMTIIHVIFKNKSLLINAIGLILCTTFMMFLYVKFVLFENVFALNLIGQSISIILVMICIVLCLFLIINLTIILINKENYFRQLYQHDKVD